MDIGQKIKYLRSKKNLGQLELAKLIEASDASISSYELGRAKPSIKVIHKLARVFEVTPDYFLEESITEPMQLIPNNSSITEKIVEELKNQLDFLRRMLELESEKNNRLSKTLENLSSNFQEGSSLSSSPFIGEATILKAA